MKKSFKRILTAACVAALAISAAAIPAMAGNQDFSFQIAPGSGNRFATTPGTETKDDNSDYWYFHPKSGTWDGTVSKTWAYVIPATGSGTPSGYRNVQVYKNYELEYLNTTPRAGSKLRCEIKEEKSSGYTMRGTWCP